MFIKVHKNYASKSNDIGTPYLLNVNDIQQISPTVSGSMIRYRGRIFHAVESYGTLMAKVSSVNKNFIEVHEWIKMDADGRHMPVLINAEDIVSLRLGENDSPVALTFIDEMGEVTLHVAESYMYIVDMLTATIGII